MQPRRPSHSPILAAAACGLSLVACSAPDNAATAETSQTSPNISALAGSHQVQGRTVLVRLPYYRDGNHVWVSAEDDAETGPFVFQTIDIEAGRGPGGTDVSVYEYEARGPGTGTLRFGLVPIGKSLIGPLDTRHQGSPFAVYAATVTVE